ncbi:MAG: DUF3718 domain-containing protein [Kangiellaceae bacterium]|jgi:Protein of unknown function (DUF3718)
MTLVKTTLLTALLLVIGVSQTQAANFQHSSYSLNKLQASLCLAAKANKVVKFRYQLRQAKTHIRAIYSDITCEGDSLLAVAIDNNSEQVVDYLNTKTSGLQVSSTKQLAANP